VNPFGAEALEAAGAWWRSGPCVDEPCVDEQLCPRKTRHDPPGGRRGLRKRTRCACCWPTLIPAGPSWPNVIPADGDRPAGSGGGPDRAARPPRRSPGPWPCCASTRDVIAPLGARRRSGWWRPAPPGTPEQRDPSSSALVKEVLGVAPEVLTGDEEAVLSFHRGDRGARRRPRSGAVPWSPTSAAASTEFRARRGRPAAGPTPYRSTSACVRMTERHPARRTRRRRRRWAAAVCRTSTRPWRRWRPRWPVEEARTLIGAWPGRLPRSRPSRLRLPAYDAARIHHARVAAADVHAVTRGLLAQTAGRTRRDRRDAPRARRRDRRGGRASSSTASCDGFGFAEVLVSEHGHPGTGWPGR